MIHLDNRSIYACGTLIIAIIYLMVFILRRDLRKLMLTSSVVSSPFGPLSEIFFFKDYWYPPSYFEVNVLGVRLIPEDLVFAFTAPVIGALVYPIIFNRRFDKKFDNVENYLTKIFLLAIGAFVSFALIILITKINSIFSAAISAVIISLLILSRRRDLIKMYVVTSISAALISFIFYLLFISVIGNEYLLSVWLLNPDVYGLKVFGVTIPTTEVVFFTFVSPVASLLIFYSANLRIRG